MRIRSPHNLAAAVRGQRQELRLTQAELAARAGVSRKWVSEFEAGKPTAELASVLRVLDELGLGVDVTPVAAPRPSPRRVNLDALLDEHRSE
ncbi:MAG: helix-turn-helix domain-containing protein [Actinomycetota bacterium]|nr:helix-turn-helix domain-containing protein [Actinomycetota bacterium]